MTAINTIHYGVVYNESVPDVDVPAGFITDDDSFLDWGASKDRTLHIQSRTALVFAPGQYDTVANQAIRERIERDRETLAAGLTQGQRLADYVVLTNTVDWSEDQHTWLFDGTMS